MDINKLKSFQFLEHLSEQQLLLLISKSHLLKLNPGKPLFKAGADDNSEYFLLSGEVCLHPPGKTDPILLKSNSEQARQALARGTPRPCTVTINSPSVILKVAHDTLKGLLADAPNTGFALKETLAAQTIDERKLFLQIYEDLRNNKLTLPSLPEVALKIRQLIDEGNNVKKISKAVNADPAITTKLIKAANSPLFRGTREFDTSNAAIVRLGLQLTKQLVTSFTMREVFKAQSEIIRKRMDQLWQHSIEIASICYVLARHAPGLNPEHGMIAGLLHDIGAVPILIYAEQYPDLLNQEDQLSKAIDELKGELGGVILKRWNFQEALIVSAQQAENWTREHDGEADYCDLVQVAQLHAALGTPDYTDSMPTLAEAPAFLKLSNGKWTPEESINILKEAKQQIEDTKSMLAL